MFEFEPLFFGIAGCHSPQNGGVSERYDSFFFTSESTTFWARLCIQAIQRWGHLRRRFGRGNNANTAVSISNYTLSWYNSSEYEA